MNNVPLTEELSQIGSEAEKNVVSWQACGNLDNNGGISNQGMEKRLFNKWWYWGSWGEKLIST